MLSLLAMLGYGALILLCIFVPPLAAYWIAKRTRVKAAPWVGGAFIAAVLVTGLSRPMDQLLRIHCNAAPDPRECVHNENPFDSLPHRMED